MSFLSVQDVAALLSVHENNVYRWINDGRLAAVQIVPGGPWRITPLAVDDMVRTAAANTLTRE